MGMLVFGLGLFIIMGGIQMLWVAMIGLTLIALFVAASMTVSSIVFRFCGYPEKGSPRPTI